MGVALSHQLENFEIMLLSLSIWLWSTKISTKYLAFNSWIMQVYCIDQLNLISHFGTSQPSAVNTILSQDLKLIYCMVHTNPSYAYKLFKSRTFFIFHQAHGYIILTKLFLAFLVFSTPKIEFLVLGEENYIFFSLWEVWGK